MFKKLVFLTLVTINMSASAAIVLNLDGIDYSLLTAVLDTDDNQLRVDSGVQLLCSGGTPPSTDNVTLTFDQTPAFSFALNTLTIDRIAGNTEVTAQSINQDVICNVDPGEDIFFLDGFEGLPSAFR